MRLPFTTPQETVMPINAPMLAVVAGSLLLLAVCSTSLAETATCKDFPVPIYPSHTSLTCETGSGQPLRHTAYVESADPVAMVTAFYKTKVQAAGWTVDPMEVESPGRAVVGMKKGKGYATAVINGRANGSGSRIQIHAYPTGN
jgi:hypothetical protein